MRSFVIALFFVLTCVSSAQEIIDRIVAVVDNEIILQSELDFQVNLLAAQRSLNPKDPKLQKQILNAIVEEKLLYAQAELDSIVVSDDEVQRQLDYQLNYFIQQYGSKEKVEQAYGMNIDRIKRELRGDLRKNLMVEMVKNKKFGRIEVSRREVGEFFDIYEDSLGLIPEKFTLAHIFINPQASEKVRNTAREFAGSLLDSIKEGGDFDKLAREFSDDPGSASQGGDLGFVKRGVFFPEFESAAFALKPNELSTVIESPVGFHIIQLLERRGESIHTRHILIKIKNDDDADLRAIEFLSEVRDSIINTDNPFEYYARKYSDDKETARFGGVLGAFEVSQLDKSLLDVVYKLKEGEIGFPKRLDIDANTYGYHIVKLQKRTPEHKANLENDYDEIKKLAEFNKKQKLYLNWMKELKDQIYWEIRI